MKIELFKLGSISIPGYGFMIGIGFIIALFVGEFRAKRKGLKDEAVIDIAVIAAIMGFVGAKILFIIVDFKSFIHDPLHFLGSSGFVIYGGIISGILCNMLYCKVKKLDFLTYFDLIMPEISIAQGFGRIGCFLAGCCYGKETDSVFSVVFPEGGQAPAGVALIPVQIYSAIGNFVIAVILIVFADIVFKKSKKSLPGDIASMYMVLYGIGRFGIEFFRNDYRGAIGFLSTSQFISIFIVAIGIALYVVKHKREAKTITY